MGREFKIYLNGDKIWTCKCGTHLAEHKELISKDFQGRCGPAYLFRQAVNVSEGETKEKQFTTGKHVVTDLHCTFCLMRVGWKYIKAYVETQKYKEGRVILEKSLLMKLQEDL
eukprot:TRINITY_DN91468_c0_g1_i1.p1 TRINITY_DN91468_c0_g1~~TRINITY_DN91468_c0_g1_i1.p1  ORF type:complete len:113 (+),score=13.28 TRINITY_DN91468_c0_g1_i1:216-554(+)